MVGRLQRLEGREREWGVGLNGNLGLNSRLGLRLGKGTRGTSNDFLDDCRLDLAGPLVLTPSSLHPGHLDP